jgi:hypothetical protein
MDQFHLQHLRHTPNLLPHRTFPNIFHSKKGNTRCVRNCFIEQLKSFCFKVGTCVGDKPSDVPAGTRKARHKSSSDGIVTVWGDDWHSFGQTPQCLSHKITATRYDHVGIEINELRRELANPLKLPLCRPAFQHQVLPLDIS